MPSPQVTTVLGQKYAVKRALGHGGMGSVFEVENLITGKRAALKRLHQRFDDIDDAESKRRVIHEARAMARIRHRNVVDVYDVFEDEGRVCLVMELLVGELLSARVAREQVALPRFITWLIAAMRGVAAAHAVGVTHRDIKPENIFLAQDREHADPVTVVIDFGVSKLHATEIEPLSHATVRSGVAMGTPRYVSYEQLRGLRDVDGRTDVYAFGVMLYEAIAGVPPYDASTFPEQAIRFLTTTPSDLCASQPELPRALGELVHAAIARDRAARPQTMDDFVVALAPFAQAEAYAAPLYAFPKRDVSRCSSSPTRADAALQVLRRIEPDAPITAIRPSQVSRRRMARVAPWVGLLAALSGFAFVRSRREAPSESAIASPASGSVPLASALNAQPEAIEVPQSPTKTLEKAAQSAVSLRSRTDPGAPRNRRTTRVAALLDDASGVTSAVTTEVPPDGGQSVRSLSANPDPAPATPVSFARPRVEESPHAVMPRAGRMHRTEF